MFNSHYAGWPFLWSKIRLKLTRLLARLQDVLTVGQFVLDGLSVSKFISRRKVDGFLTKFPHERDWFLYFRNSAPQLTKKPVV